MIGAYAPVPQLDRGAVYETDSCGFKSRRARQRIGWVEGKTSTLTLSQWYESNATKRVATPVD